MNQIERAEDELRRIHGALVHINPNPLGEVLDEAQNGPPQGASDGSFDQESWDLVRAAYSSLRDAKHRVARAMHAVEQRTKR